MRKGTLSAPLSRLHFFSRRAGFLSRHRFVKTPTRPALPPSIMPVVILRGSDYQMGHQYGEQAGQYIEAQKDAAWVAALEMLGSCEKVLHELFSQAVAEYYEGVNANNKGVLAEGVEALYYLARAARAFARSEAHAKQVYNALVPPPTSPEDLGLEPYGGTWAQWATK